MSRLTREWTPEPVSRDQILGRERGQRKTIFFLFQLTELEPYAVDPYDTLAILWYVVFFTFIDRASTIPSNIHGCQSGTWSAGQKKIRGTSTKLQREQNKNKNKQKQKRQRERNKNNKIHMPEKDRRRALVREILA